VGGVQKFYRTRRVNTILNKPMSMFEDTHLQTSSKVAKLFDPVKTAKEILIENDTSFCEGYDQPGVDMVTLAGMS